MKWLEYSIVVLIGIHVATAHSCKDIANLVKAILEGIEIGVNNYLQSETGEKFVGGGESAKSRYSIIDLKQR